MAIFKNVEITVKTGEVTLKEYDDDEDIDDNYRLDATTKYVEAISGVPFQIMVSIPKTFLFTSDGLEFETSMDGHDIHDSFRTKEKNPTRDYCCTIKGCEGMVNNAWTVRPFLFSEIEICESSTLSSARIALLRGIQWKTQPFRRHRNMLCLGQSSSASFTSKNYDMFPLLRR